MFTLKHLKTPQHVSIIIQIIFREVVCSLLKLLILKFVKNVKKSMWWCGSMLPHHHIAASPHHHITTSPHHHASISIAVTKPVSLMCVFSAAELQSNMIDFRYVARKMKTRMMCVLCKHVERHCSCLHSVSVASKHFLLFQLMHTTIKIIEC